MNFSTLRLHDYQSGLAARFATCPPRFALLLDLRKTHSQPAPLMVIFDFKIQMQNLLSSSGHGVSAAAKSRRSPKGAGDMSAGRYDVAVAG
jgi:hypothetical protein